MTTIKQLKRAAQIERRVGLHAAFTKLMNEKYGRALVVGDVLTLPIDDVINGYLSGDQHSVQMIVYAVGANIDSHEPAIALIKMSNNTTTADPHNNYALAYGKTRLKRAKLIGKADLIATAENVGYCAVGSIENEVAVNL